MDKLDQGASAGYTLHDGGDEKVIGDSDMSVTRFVSSWGEERVNGGKVLNVGGE